MLASKIRGLLREPAAGYSWAVVLAGAGALAASLPAASWPGTPQVVALCLASVAANALMVPMPAGGYQTLGAAVVATGLALYGAPTAALATAVGVVLGTGVHSRRALLVTLFNAGQSVLAVLAASASASLIYPTTLRWSQPLFLGRIDTPFAVAMLVATAAFVFVSSTLVSWRISVDRRAAFAGVLGANVPLEVVNTFVLFVLGAVAGLVVANHLPYSALLLIVPVALISFTLMAYSLHRQAGDELEVLYATTGEIGHNRSGDEIAHAVAVAVDRLVPSDIALVWVRPPSNGDGRVAHYRGPGTSEVARALASTELFTKVMTSGRPARIDDLDDEEQERRSAVVDRLFGPGVARAALIVPMTTHGEVWGAIGLIKGVRGYFNARQVRLVTILAAQAALALRSTELHETAGARLRHLEALAAISRRVVGERSLRGVLDLITESARDVLGVDRSALLVWDGHGAVGEVHTSGLSEPFVQALRQHVRASIGRALLRATSPVVVSDLSGDAEMGPLRAAAATEGLRTGTFFPLHAHGEFVGMLMLCRSRADGYRPHELAFAESLAEQAGVAVKRAALLAQSQRRRDEMVLLNSIVGSVSATLDLNEVFRAAVQELSAATGVPYVSLYRVEGSWLRLTAQAGYQDLPADLSQMSGIRGRVARSGRPEFVTRVRDDGSETATGFDVTARAAVPILLDSNVIGVLAIEGTSARPTTPQTYELMIALGQQLSVAARNAALYEELRKAHEELQVLYEAARSVSGTLDLRTVLDSLVSVTCRAFAYDNGALLMVDGETGELTVDAWYGQRESIAGTRLPAGIGITGWVARTGTPLLVDDVTQDSRYYRFDDRTRSELAVPLIAEGKVLGVLNVESARLAAFGQRDLHMLTTLASYAVIAIQNANLFEQARRLAVTDGLTELHNHRFLYEALGRMLERAKRDAQPLSLIMLELDNFKRFNDTYGHQSGDEVLRTIAMLLRRGSRPSDIVARYGGDEFMLVLPSAGRTPAEETAERLRRAVEAYPLVLGDDVITTVTLSVGVATYPTDGQTVDALVEAVDRAQYIAKRSGGNKVHISRGA